MLRNTLVAAMMLAFCGSAGAAGLGRINVMSALGQPLRAEVELSASPEELESMVARLAPAEAFKRANVEYLAAFSGVKMAVERRAGKSVVKITTDRPFNEPFVDLLIDLNWVGGRLQREYTFLLDPVDASPAVVPAPAAPLVSAPVNEGRAPVAATPAERPAASASQTKPSVAPAPAPVAGDYAVKRGDTLNKIAAETKSADVSQEQMLAALYRANSDAFVGGNINRLRTGRILKVPETSSVADISRREARQIVLKASSFEQYRQSVAAAATTAPARDAAAQSATGKIAPKVEEKAVSASQGKDKVKVTAAEGKSSAAAGDAASKARLQALQDDIVAREKALKEANSRVADLEKNVRELQKLVDLKNKGLADAQAAAKAAESRADKAEKDKSQAEMSKAEKAKADKLAAAKAEEARKAEELRLAEEAKKAEEARKAEETKKAEDAKKAAEEARVAEEARKAAAEAAASAPVAASAPAEATPVVQASAPAAAAHSVAAAPKVEPAPVEDEGLFSNPLLAMLGLAGVAGAVGYVVIKQRRKQAAAGSGNTQLTESSTTSPNSVFGSAGGQTVDTGGTSLLHTDFSQSGMSAIDADEGVDPVAEADVYMAYGRDAQAEEILLDALKNDPSRTAIYLKLLEIYSQRRALKQFENIATDLYTQTAGVGDDWAKAAAMGLKLDPNNPLYKMSAGEAAPGVEPEVAEVPAELDLPIDEPEAAEAEAPAVSFGTNNISQVRSTWTVPGEINQFTTGENDMPVLAEAAPTAVVQPVPESLNLDFNLDLETPAGEDQPTELEPREDDEILTMDEAISTQPSLPGEDAPLEFDIGLDDEPAQEPVAPAPAAQFEEDLDLGIEASSRGESLAEVDLEKTNFESSLLDFDFELGEETNTRPTVMDLSSVNLRSESAAPSPSLTASVVHEPIQDNIDVNEEVATKLELAKAYEEMGDAEGARELLEEVINDGADFQKEQARTMLGRLS